MLEWSRFCPTSKPILHTDNKMPEVRAKFWMFTAFDVEDGSAGKSTHMREIPNLSYIVWGLETAPTTGKLHWQGYLELSIRTKLSTLKKLYAATSYGDWFKTIHWEVPKHYDTWEECRAYSLKDGGERFEWGTGTYDKVLSKRKQGKRTDLDDMRDAIQSKRVKTTTDLENYVGLTYQGMLFGDRLLRNARPERPGVPDVYWLHGRTGVGKSRYAHEFIDELNHSRGYDCWMAFDNSLKWFDGYGGQEIVLFDDFRGSDAHFPTLLRITDRYVCRVPVKGASAWWSPRIIIFTSSQSLEAGFGFLGESDRSDQFVRRVSEQGEGGSYCFDDPERVISFRNRIDRYLVPAVLPVDPDGTAPAEAFEDSMFASQAQGSQPDPFVGSGLPSPVQVGSPAGSLPLFGLDIDGIDWSKL